MRLGYINRNVARISVIPETFVEKRQRKALTHEQWSTIYEAATGNLKLVIDFGGRHGLRPQEIRSLCWNQIDFDQGTVSVVTQFDSNDRFVETKTVGSVRTIQLHPETIDRLKGLRPADLLPSSKRAYDDLVIRTRNNTPIAQGNLRRDLKAICYQSDVPEIIPYELRHTAITHQIDAGFTASQVADWAGNNEKMIYEHYRHRLREVSALPPINHDSGFVPTGLVKPVLEAL